MKKKITSSLSRNRGFLGLAGIFLLVFSEIVLAISTPVLTNPLGIKGVSPVKQDFSWNSVVGAITYRIVVVEAGHLGDFVDANASSSCSNNTTCFTDKPSGTAYQGFNLKGGTDYEWYVRASSANSASTLTLAKSTFQTALSQPTLISPTANNQSVPISSQNFSWSAVPKATSYRLLVVEAGHFSDFSAMDCSSSTKNVTCFTNTTSATTLSGFTLKAGVNYEWYVRAGSSSIVNSSWASALFKTATSSTGTNYTLTVNKTGTGTGTVKTADSKINCGSACSASYASNASVTLTATPTPTDSQFTGWSGACTGTGNCIVPMTSAKSVTANFSKKATAFKVWIDKNGNQSFGTGEEVADATVKVIHADKTEISVGKTDANGMINISNLLETDKIYVEKEFYHEDVAKSKSSDVFSSPANDSSNPYRASNDKGAMNNTRYTFVMASDIRTDDKTDKVAYYDFPGKGNTLSLNSNTTTLIELVHPKFEWNLTLCFEDPHTESPHLDDYYTKVKSGLQQYSDYVYDYTDGYAVIKNIAVVKGAYQNTKQWNICDIRVLSRAKLRAEATIYQTTIVDQTTKVLRGYEADGGVILMGRTDTYDDTLPDKNQWFKILGHESGHYLFSFSDEYTSCLGAQANDWTYRVQHQAKTVNGVLELNEFPLSYGVMDKQHSSTELSDSTDYFTRILPVKLKNESDADYQKRVSDYKNMVNLHYCPSNKNTWDFFKIMEEFLVSKNNKEQKLGFSNKFIKSLIILPNIGKNYSKDWLQDEATKRAGPDVLNHDVLNIIDWTVPNTTALDVFDAPVHVTDSHGKSLSNVEVKLNTPQTNGINARITAQGTTGADGRLNITSFIAGINQTIEVVCPNGEFANPHNITEEDTIYTVTCSPATSPSQPMQRTRTAAKAPSQVKVPAQEKDGFIFNIKPKSNTTHEIELSVTAKDRNFFVSTPKLILSQSGGHTENVSSSAQNNGYVGTSSYTLDSGFVNLSIQSQRGLLSGGNQFQVYSTDFRPASGYPSPDGQLEVLFASEGFGKFIINSTILPPPENRNLVQVGSVWSFGFADTVKAVRDVAFNIRIDGKTTGLDATQLKLYGWDKLKNQWRAVQGGSNDLKEFNISFKKLDYEAYALFAPKSDDNQAPNAVAGFQAYSGDFRWAVNVQWLAPSDNKKVYVYDIRFNTQPITENNWASSLPISYWATPKPAHPNNIETISVDMPDPDTNYYFAIRSADASGNWSALATLASPVTSHKPEGAVVTNPTDGKYTIQVFVRSQTDKKDDCSDKKDKDNHGDEGDKEDNCSNQNDKHDKDNHGDKGLKNAKVVLDSTQTAITNGGGHAKFKSVKAGSHTLAATLKGYTCQIVPVTLSKKPVVSVTIPCSKN